MNERLKELRLKLNLSQEDFGEKINIKSRAHISLLESGDRKMTDRIISDICRTYNVNEIWFKTGEGNIFQLVNSFEEFFAMNYKNLDEMDKKIITEYIKLSSDHRNIIKGFIRKMI